MHWASLKLSRTERGQENWETDVGVEGYKNCGEWIKRVLGEWGWGKRS
jgi:hypothetical protein